MRVFDFCFGWVIIYFLLIAEVSAAQMPSNFEAKIDSFVSNLVADAATPGFTILVSKGKDKVYEKHIGLANIEHSIPITDSTVFEVGSVSKQFTATAIMLLVAEGKISLDDDIHLYIPELPKYGETVTIANLIYHTSGLKDWGAIARLGGWPRGSRVYSNVHALNYVIKQPTLNNKPGDEYLYSNSNYILLALIVERVSGQTFQAFTSDRIFKRLGMLKTRWRTDYTDIIPNRAIAYDSKETVFFMQMPFENTYGHAALLTTARDLLLWNNSWRDTAFWGGRISELRMRRGILANGERLRYAAGVNIGTYRDHKEISHAGLTAGYRAWLAYYPDFDVTVIYLSNNAAISVDVIHRFFLETLCGSIQDVKPTAEKNLRPAEPVVKGLVLKEYVGKFVSEQCNGSISITQENESLCVIRNFSKAGRLMPEKTDHFVLLNETYAFKRDVKGQIEGLFVSLPNAKNIWFRKDLHSIAPLPMQDNFLLK